MKPKGSVGYRKTNEPWKSRCSRVDKEKLSSESYWGLSGAEHICPRVKTRIHERRMGLLRAFLVG